MTPKEDLLNLDVLDSDNPEEDRKPSGTYFIRAQHPGIREDEVTAAAFTLGGTQTKEGEVTLTGDVRTAAAFITKCVVQIIGFCLPVIDKTGQPGERKWDDTNDGDNDGNREMYARLMDATLVIGDDGETFLEVVTGFLDSVADRGTEFAEKHETVGRSLPRSMRS
jgi:hypothetical protein